MNNALAAVTFALTSVIWSYRALRAVQMGGYRLSIGELRPHSVRIGTEYFILFLLAAAGIVGAALQTLGVALGVLLVVAVYGLLDAKRLRTHYKFTKRAIRLAVASSVLIAAAGAIPVALIHNKIAMVSAGFAVLLFARPVVLAVNAALRPFENLNNKRYLRLAEAKLDSLRAVKIGITGSYGKTSCKNILAELLAVKYKVIKTEKNYNTPLGIARTAKNAQGDEEVFIAEMGARRPGEIRELCELVKPKYAIVTGVGPQHLSTFKTQEGVYKTKKELIDCLPPDGFAVFNGDNGYALRMADECPVRYSVVSTAAQTSKIYAYDIQLSNNGSSFYVKGLGDEFCLTTRLLGRHNIINILLCLALAAELGVEKTQLVETVKNLKPVPHRLELLDTDNGVTVIDDSYNGNLEGVRFALEVLALYKDKRKVVFTQGIVELGRKAAEINTLVGAMTAQVADFVILTGENAAYIKRGLVDSGFSAENIREFRCFNEAQEGLKSLLRRNDVLLIQNDIP